MPGVGVDGRGPWHLDLPDAPRPALGDAALDARLLRTVAVSDEDRAEQEAALAWVDMMTEQAAKVWTG